MSIECESAREVLDKRVRGTCIVLTITTRSTVMHGYFLLGDVA